MGDQDVLEVKRLLKLDHRYESTGAALEMAVLNNSYACLKMLLKTVTDPGVIDRALIAAVQSDYGPSVDAIPPTKFLLDHPLIQDVSIRRAMVVAAKSRNVVPLSMLLTKMEGGRSEMKTALIEAVKDGYADVVNLLLEQIGQDSDSIAEAFCAALELEEGVEIVNLLLKKVDPKRPDVVKALELAIRKIVDVKVAILLLAQVTYRQEFITKVLERFLAAAAYQASDEEALLIPLLLDKADPKEVKSLFIEAAEEGNAYTCSMLLTVDIDRRVIQDAYDNAVKKDDFYMIQAIEPYLPEDTSDEFHDCDQ